MEGLLEKILQRFRTHLQIFNLAAGFLLIHILLLRRKRKATGYCLIDELNR